MSPHVLLQPGLYILGLISRSAASQAGLQQGDRIIAVDGIELRQESPFQAAALIAGPEAQGAPPLVTVQARPTDLFGRKIKQHAALEAHSQSHTCL